VKRKSENQWLEDFKDRLDNYSEISKSNPQTNAVSLLAFEISKLIESRELAFRDIEAIIKLISDEGAIGRVERLRQRSGYAEIKKINAEFEALAESKASEGFKTYKRWAESVGQGIVLTAHPTFCLPTEIYKIIGKMATAIPKAKKDLAESLKAQAYSQKHPMTLQEEHRQTQLTLMRIQTAIETLNAKIFEIARSWFPKQWTDLTPRLYKVYSWVGYDIDGRTDIDWGDAIRLRLSEKKQQVSVYLKQAENIRKTCAKGAAEIKAIDAIINRFDQALQSTQHDLELFNKDLTNTGNLVEAANHLTRSTKRRLRSTKSLYPLIDDALNISQDEKVKQDLLLLRARLKCFGLGTARLHFRVNSRHVMEALRPEFGLSESGSNIANDERTLSKNIAKKIDNIKPSTINFASLATEKITARRQLILIAQIQKYIDNETPVRMLIAECENSIVPLGMLYLARTYGLENDIDISPLFETGSALNNAGRTLSKMLSYKSYRDYVQKRKVFAVQTGFSDAGRFMGQVPATLSIERAQSHLASVMKDHGLKDVKAVIFNTHGESMGRGGHPGTLDDRLSYVMSPWAMQTFEKRGIEFCHETSFQGGDGFLWFQTDTLSQASLLSMITSRYRSHETAHEDIFYQNRDFSWDIFQTLSFEQERLYASPDYTNILGPFSQNLLIKTGSRAVKRPGTGASVMDPRSIRAIPHNAILQQYSISANIYFGFGRAAHIDPDGFTKLYAESDRFKRVMDLALLAMKRADKSILTAYSRLFDPDFWLGRALSGQEPWLIAPSHIIVNALMQNTQRNHIESLSNILGLDKLQFDRAFTQAPAPDNSALRILSALRIAVLMKMQILAAQLPQFVIEGSSNVDILQRLQENDVERIIADLKAQYPERGNKMDWIDSLTEVADNLPSSNEGFPHLAETIIKPLERASQLSKQVTIALTHHYDAFG